MELLLVSGASCGFRSGFVDNWTCSDVGSDNFALPDVRFNYCEFGSMQPRTKSGTESQKGNKVKITYHVVTPNRIPTYAWVTGHP